MGQNRLRHNHLYRIQIRQTVGLIPTPPASTAGVFSDVLAAFHEGFLDGLELAFLLLQAILVLESHEGFLKFPRSKLAHQE